MSDNRILVISQIGCGTFFAGNRTRMATLLREIRRLGFAIHFAGVEMSNEERETTLPHIDKWVTNFCAAKPNLKVRVIRKLARMLTGTKPVDWSSCMTIDQLFDREWTSQAKRIQLLGNYERVMVAYVFHSAFLNCFPETCLKLLDTHDVFAERNARLSAGGESSFWFNTSQKEERTGVMRANRILAIQSHEAAYFRQLTNNERPVFTVGHFTEPRFLPPPAEAFPVIGMFASDNPLNISGLDWFLKLVWPLVLVRHPKATLRVGGGICACIVDNLAVKLIGKVEEPADFYAQCSFTINPIQVGTGLKIKTVESLSFGRPVVVSPPGAEGLESCAGRGLLIAENAPQFAHHIDQLLQAPSEIERLGRLSVEAIMQFNREARDDLTRALDKKQTA